MQPGMTMPIHHVATLMQMGGHAAHQYGDAGALGTYPMPRNPAHHGSLTRLQHIPG